MAFAFNLLWFVFGGFLMGITWLLFSALMCCTVIGIPFGIASFRIAQFAFLPFGKELIDAEMVGEKQKFGTGFFSILWIIFAGFWLAMIHAMLGVAYCITVIGIPAGLAHFNLSKASFAPLGKRIVSKEMAKAYREKYVSCAVENKLTENKPAPKVTESNTPHPKSHIESTSNPLPKEPAASKPNIIAISCPGCNSGFKAPASAAGKNAKCPKCEQRFIIKV